MRLTKSTSHAIRILIDCAQAGDRLIKVAELSGRLDITQQNVFKIVNMLARAGLFRMATPKEIGGLELLPSDIFRAIETVSEADASAGWCVMIGTTSGMTSAWLPPQIAQPIFGPPDVVTCGVFAPMGRAVEDGDDYVVNGKWQWASGSANCDWLMGGCAIIADGAPKKLPNGALDSRMLIFPREKVELIDSWNVSGLCGTGSGEMQVKDLRVRRECSASIVVDRPHAGGALYAFPVFGLLALGVASVLTGNAQAAVDELVELAGGKKPQGSARVLAEIAARHLKLVAEPGVGGEHRERPSRRSVGQRVAGLRIAGTILPLQPTRQRYDHLYGHGRAKCRQQHRDHQRRATIVAS